MDEEKVTTFYAVSDAPLTNIASGPSAGEAVAGAGFTALPAAANTQISSATTATALDGYLALNRSAVDFVPLCCGEQCGARFDGVAGTVDTVNFILTVGRAGAD